MGYDYSACKKQYDSNAAKYKKAEGMEEDGACAENTMTNWIYLPRAWRLML